jgi:RNA-directed DNA polymerase
MNTVDPQPLYGWNTLAWKKIERRVFKLQTRIYRAQRRGEGKTVRKLQRLLMKARSAKLLAVRRVTQDNRGKATAGVDGVQSLTPAERLDLADTLSLNSLANPVRRVRIPKPGTEETRPLGMPTLQDRALQAVVKLALDPQWEARFEPNSYGFRPGRSPWDAIGAIYVLINQKAKWVRDADITKCFDRINHDALLKKMNPSPTLRRQIRAWLKAGVMDKGEWFPTEEGTPQGGPLSPLLANIALHGLEESIKRAVPRQRHTPAGNRYADDLVVLHPDRQAIEQCQAILSEELKGMGLELKPSKTRIVHTLHGNGGAVGFDFLGCHIRQYPVRTTRLGFKTIIKPSPQAVHRQHRRIREVIAQHQTARQAQLILTLNPVIRGWSRYFSTVCSQETFGNTDRKLLNRLRTWTKRRHPDHSRTTAARKYWKREGGKLHFSPPHSALRLRFHPETHIQRHVKVQSHRSPYDGDWLYWSTRLGRHPGVSTRVATLLKRQQGRCPRCGLHYCAGDVLEVDHLIPTASGGKEGYDNWQLLHGHCHDEKTAEDRHRYA